jgi:hypothetical protein
MAARFAHINPSRPADRSEREESTWAALPLSNSSIAGSSLCSTNEPELPTLLYVVVARSGTHLLTIIPMRPVGTGHRAQGTQDELCSGEQVRRSHCSQLPQRLDSCATVLAARGLTG